MFTVVFAVTRTAVTLILCSGRYFQGVCFKAASRRSPPDHLLIGPAGRTRAGVDVS